jgi:hypothetical protein
MHPFDFELTKLELWLIGPFMYNPRLFATEPDNNPLFYENSIMKNSVLPIIGISVITFLLCNSILQATIFQWAWVDPTDPSQGKIQSSNVCIGGTGVSAVPNAFLTSRNLTQAYLIGADLTNSRLIHATLTNADLTDAIVKGTYFSFSNLTASQLYSTASYQAKDLSGIIFLSQIYRIGISPARNSVTHPLTPLS